MYKILIIEDHPDVRKLIRISLEFNHYDIHEASDGETGLEMAKLIHPDLILMDIMMPGRTDGYQLCNTLKSQEEFKSTPIIFLTARGQEQDIISGYQAGCDNYLIKPFSPIKLADTVETYLANKDLP
ncbi:response regulator [Methylobacillus caricis]|uniref:response regulator transcription factor n=1 Tax=Methylobacillus caricis TaxID=1971611 RepID=UPI001D00083A|nr:response regulator [Methylobacillus caricis]MCB5187682.1 response regulator [Methylobacillus caricis]